MAGKRNPIFPVLLTLLVAAIACAGPGQPSPFPTDDMTLIGGMTALAETVVAADKLKPPPTATPVPQPTGGPATLPAQSWLLFSTSAEGLVINTLWLAAADGSEVRPLIENQQIIVPGEAGLSAAISPDNRYMAYITTSDPDGLRNLTLNLISLPDGNITAITRLTSDQTEPQAEFLFDDPAFEVVRSMTEVNSLAWSPDSQYLAFMGAMDGPSSDLYVYSLRDGSITRLTDGPSQSILPIWSPDGRWIVHAGVSSLGTGAGYGMEGVWAAAVDGSEVRTLYEPDSSGETWVGWVTTDRLVVYSWSPICGPVQLRTVRVPDGSTQMLFEGFFTEAAVDLLSGSVAFVLDEYVPECTPGAQAGVFLIPLGETQPMRVIATPGRSIYWDSTAGLFVARTADGALMGIAPDGEIRDLGGPPDAEIALAPGGQMIAWTVGGVDSSRTGLWIGSAGSTAQRVSDLPFYFPTWNPAGDRVFAFSGDTLYMFSAPDFTPVVVATFVNVGNWRPVWIVKL